MGMHASQSFLGIQTIASRNRIRFLSRQLVGHALNLGHVVVPNRSGVAIIPRNGNTTPRRSDDCAKIGSAILPANAVGYFKKPGLIPGHCKYHGLTAQHDCSDYDGPGNTLAGSFALRAREPLP